MANTKKVNLMKMDISQLTAYIIENDERLNNALPSKDLVGRLHYVEGIMKDALFRHAFELKK